jgi:hypothetical protein
MGCFYLFDIRIDGPAVAFGLNAFQWIHSGLFVVAIGAGAAASSSQRAVLACVIMILSEIAGIMAWVVHIVLHNPGNNLWPLGLILFSGCGAIVIITGMLFGFLFGTPMRKARHTRASNKSR